MAYTYRGGIRSPFRDTIASPKFHFASTAPMIPVNSVYSSHPQIHDDGTAIKGFLRIPFPFRDMFDGDGDGDSGVVIIGEPDPNDDFYPLGDAIWPLILMLILYIVWKKRPWVIAAYRKIIGQRNSSTRSYNQQL